MSVIFTITPGTTLINNQYHSFWNQEQNAIATTSLEQTAQDALASGVAANAKADTLLATALQVSGSYYTGLPDAGIQLKDATDTTTFLVDGNSGDLGAKGTVTGFGFANTNSSFQVNDIGNCTVNQLTYTTLNPPITPGATPTLAEVLAAGNDGGTYAIVNISQMTTNDSLQILKDADHPELGTYSLASGLTGFNVGEGASLTATTLVGSSPDGIAFQNVDASFKANFDGSVNATSFNLPNSTSIVSGGNGIISFDNANLTDIVELTVGTLNYTTLNPAISTPTLAQVLAVGSDGNQVDISNCGSITANSFVTAGDVQSTSVTVLSGLATIAGLSSAGVARATSLDIRTSTNTLKAQIDASGNITCGTVNSVKPEFKPTYDVYVAKGGNDTTGTGSILAPYLTIQKAITICEAFSDGIPRVVNVAAGSYTENLTFTKSRISIQGQGQSSHPDIGTSIYGTITIAITSGNSDLNNNNIYFSGFLINGQVEDSTASVSYPHRVFFDHCQLYANNRVLYVHPSGDFRVFVSNCVISNDNTSATDPVVECYSSSTGMVSFTSNQITSKGTSQNVFKLSGSCRTDTFAQNIFTSDSTGTNVAVAIFVHNSTAVITLGQNAFVYSSSGAKRNADTASGIFMNAASAGGSIVLVNNVFGLTGLPLGQNAVQNNSSAGVVIFGSNVSTSSNAGTSAFAISGTLNVNKFAMTSVQ